MAKKDPSHSEVILAAGGIVWRNSPQGRQIAVVHRPNYHDWTLPKGKLSADESWQEAAVREVEEETGLEVRIGDFAGSCSYLTKRAPKVVLFWHMDVVGESKFAGESLEEVDAMEWLSLEDARKRLSHRRERRVITEIIATAGTRRKRRAAGEASS